MQIMFLARVWYDYFPGRSIYAFHTKLQQIPHVMYHGFGQDITRSKYFYHVTLFSINVIDL